LARSGRTSWWPQPAAGIVTQRNAAPQQRLEENDQIDPAGRWGWLLNGDILTLQHATSAEWAATEDWISFDKAAEQINFGKTVNIATTVEFDDDEFLQFGTSQDVQMGWETEDADANVFLLELPTGGAVDVPVIVIGQGVTGVDLGLYNGVVDPRIAIFGIGAVTTASVWEFRKARGTIAAPTAITTGDDLGSINAYACVANGEWRQSAAIVFDSVGTIATTRGPGEIQFWTATDVAPSVLTKRLTIAKDGRSTFTSNVTVTGTVDATYMQIQSLSGVFYMGDGGSAGVVQIMASDVAVGWAEIARIVSAADPYVQIGRDDTGVALNAVTDMLVVQAGGGTGNESAGFGFGMSWKIGNAASEVEERGSIDLVLQTATNASEDASWIFKAMAAGAMTTVMSFGGYVGVSKLGFYASAPVALQTGVAVTAAGIHAALVNLGLITA